MQIKILIHLPLPKVALMIDCKLQDISWQRIHLEVIVVAIKIPKCNKHHRLTASQMPLEDSISNSIKWIQWETSAKKRTWRLQMFLSSASSLIWWSEEVLKTRATATKAWISGTLYPSRSSNHCPSTSNGRTSTDTQCRKCRRQQRPKRWNSISIHQRRRR